MANLFSDKTLKDDAKVKSLSMTGDYLNTLSFGLDSLIDSLREYAAKLKKADRSKGRKLEKEINQLEREMKAVWTKLNKILMDDAPPGDLDVFGAYVEENLPKIKKELKKINKGFKAIESLLARS